MQETKAIEQGDMIRLTRDLSNDPCFEGSNLTAGKCLVVRVPLEAGVRCYGLRAPLIAGEYEKVVW